MAPRAMGGMVHLGVGAFHRAHQAVYTQEAGDGWRICGVSLRRAAVRDRLQGRGWRYTLAVKDDGETRLQQMDVLDEVLVAPEAPAQVIGRLAAAETHLATLTVTEKGYCLDAAGALDLAQADITHDLAHPRQPRSALGYLAAGMAARRQAGLPGLTLLSCDNLADNGGKLKGALLALAQRQDAGLADWIAAECRFPASMVDRIVPATTPEDHEAAKAMLGFEDPGLVVAEPFSQWVIEDNFAGPRPAWEKAGAQLVADVAPFEAMKLRLLNASHSALAYLGCLAGKETIAEALAEPACQALIQQLMMEMSATLEGLDGFDLPGYRQALLRRLCNRGLRHLCRQVAMDGSQKIPQRFFPALERQIAAGLPFEAASLALAAWVRYTMTAGGTKGGLDDPKAEEFARLRQAAKGDPARYLSSLMQKSGLFPPALAASPALHDALRHWLQALASEGALATVRRRFPQ